MNSIFSALMILGILISGSALADPECMPALLQRITTSRVPLTSNELVNSDEVSNLQERIFHLRVHGKNAEAQVMEDKISTILKGPYFYSSTLSSGAAGGRYYYFDLGIVGVGKKAGRHWSTDVDAEVAAFQIDRLYDLNLVPLTVSRDDASGRMSMQLFYKGAKDARVQNLQSVSQSDLQKMRIFDYLIQNFDRKDTNYLVTKEGRLVAIDHGVSLHNVRSNPYSPHAPKLDELDLGFFKTDSGRPFLDKLKKVSDADIKQMFGKMGNEASVQKFIDRKNALLKAVFEH